MTINSRLNNIRGLQVQLIVQWNPDFWNTRLFETPDSSN